MTNAGLRNTIQTLEDTFEARLQVQVAHVTQELADAKEVMKMYTSLHEKLQSNFKSPIPHLISELRGAHKSQC